MASNFKVGTGYTGGNSRTFTDLHAITTLTDEIEFKETETETTVIVKIELKEIPLMEISDK
ncbi:MAG: hypothetical protein R3C03_09125 [Pirellulaceae bacterium]